MATLTLPRTIARSTTAALLAGIVAGGLAIRLYAIGAKSLWIDESFSIWMAAQPLGSLWGYTVQLDQHPPLYYTLLHFWLALGDSEAVARGFSALWGVAALPVIYLIGRRVGGPALGLLAALILALSPLHISFAQDARMYTMLTFFAGMAILCMLHLLGDEQIETEPPRRQVRQANAANQNLGVLAVKKSRLPWWVGFVVFTTLTMLGHNTAIFFPIAIALFVAGAIGLPALLRPRGERNVASLWRWGIGLSAALLLWLPWLPSFLVQSRRVYGEFWIQPPTSQTVLEHWRDVGSAFGPGGPYLVPLVLCFAGFALLGGWRLRRQPAAVALLLLLILVPFAGELLVSMRRPIFYTRTLIWTTLPFYVLLAAGLLRLRARPLIGAVVLALVGLNLYSLYGYFRYYEPEDWRGTARYVASQAQPGDLLLFNAGWMQIPFDYYYRGGPPAAEHGLPADLFDRGILEPKMTAADTARLGELIAGHPRVWLLYSHNWYTDPQTIIPPYLDKALGAPSVRDFNGIKIFLYR